MSKERIKWIDIYKGLGIILMVIGHSTGLFNKYIYQFHMAAFFVISGYTTNLERDSFGHYFYKKLYSLYIPLLSITVIGAVFMAGLNSLGLYSYLYASDVYPYIGFVETIKRFLISYDNYVWWLGTAWFILVLLQAELLQKLIYQFTESFDKSKLWYSVILISIFVFGYVCVAKGQFRFRMLDLTFIAQVYFWTGQLLKKSNIWEKIAERKSLYYLAIVISISYLYMIPKLATNFTVDYPSREFHNIILNYCSGVLGSFLLYFCAKFSEKKVKLWGIFSRYLEEIQ